MREKYESLSLGALKEIARARGMKGLSSLKKSELVERMLQEDEKIRSRLRKKRLKQKERKRSIKKKKVKKTGKKNIKRKSIEKKKDRKENLCGRLWSSLNWTAVRA